MSVQAPVIVGVGLTDESEYVLKKVIGLMGGTDRLIAVHVIEKNHLAFVDDTAVVIGDLYSRLGEESNERLRNLCEPLGINDVRVEEGNPASVLHRIAEETSARVVAVGTHGLQGWRALLGETANAVLHDTRNNVLAVLTRGDGTEPGLVYNRILVAVDLSDEADAIIAEAVRVRDRYESTLSLISVIKPAIGIPVALGEHRIDDVYDTFRTEAEKQCRERMTELASKHNIEDIIIRHGQPAAEIHDAAAEMDADLVVMGTHGTHGPALLLGSTPNAVLHGMVCDMLAVRVGL